MKEQNNNENSSDACEKCRKRIGLNRLWGSCQKCWDAMCAKTDRANEASFKKAGHNPLGD